MTTEVIYRCSQPVYDDGHAVEHCGNPAVVERDERDYCAEHDPEAEA